MPIAGAAAGAGQALEKILAEQMLRAQEVQRAREVQQRLSMDQQRFDETVRQNDAATKRQQMIDDEHSADRRQKSNQIGVRRMIGDSLMQRTGPMTQDDLRGIAAMQIEAGDTPNLSALMPPPPPKRTVVTTIGKRGEPIKKAVTDDELEAGVPEYQKPGKTGGNPPEQVFVVRDGKVIPITKGTAQPGDQPYDAVATRQADAAKQTGDKTTEGMRLYRDEMLNVVNSLLDKDGNLNPSVASVVGGFQGAWPEGTFFDEDKQSALAAIDRLQSLLNLQKLGEMKSQSRTGASGFGALSEKELAVLEAAASTLRNRRQGDVSYRTELQRIREELTKGRGASTNTGISVNAGSLPTDPAAAAQALIEKARAARKPQ